MTVLKRALWFRLMNSTAMVYRKATGYTLGAVKHGAKEWAYYDYRHDVTHHVNHVESFWKLFKKSVASTHIHGSAKHMDRHFKEFTFQSNYRDRVNLMFDLLIDAV